MQKASANKCDEKIHGELCVEKGEQRQQQALSQEIPANNYSVDICATTVAEVRSVGRSFLVFHELQET